MFKNKRIIIAVACILGACLVAGIAIFTQKVSLGNKSNVVVMASNIKKGQKIEKTNVKVLTKTATDVPPTALTDVSQAVGSYAITDLFAEDVLTPAKLSKTPVNGDLLITTMSKDKIAIAVPIAGANGFNGKLIAGDVVKLYMNNINKKDNEPLVIEPAELQYMRVISITNADMTEEAAKKDGATYGVLTFECTPYQAKKLLDASTKNLYIGYICHGNEDRASELLKAQDDLNVELEKQSQTTEAQK